MNERPEFLIIKTYFMQIKALILLRIPLGFQSEYTFIREPYLEPWLAVKQDPRNPSTLPGLQSSMIRHIQYISELHRGGSIHCPQFSSQLFPLYKPLRGNAIFQAAYPYQRVVAETTGEMEAGMVSGD
jgi:hypothetical protein